MPPIPTLLARAGAPLPRGAGPPPVALAAALEEADDLLAVVATSAVEQLGYRVVVESGSAPGGSRAPSLTAGAPDSCVPVARFVGVHDLASVAACPLCRPQARRHPPPEPWLTVTYSWRDPVVAALHRAHRCADLNMVLDGTATFGTLRHVAAPSALERAHLTPRESEVMALLLARRTNAEIAATLVVSLATVRSHCSALLRKLEVPSRRVLWRTFAGGGPAASRHPFAQVSAEVTNQPASATRNPADATSMTL